MKITWRDEDNDDVSIESDEELLIALHEMKGPLYKLSVTACHQDDIGISDQELLTMSTNEINKLVHTVSPLLTNYTL